MPDDSRVLTKEGGSVVLFDPKDPELSETPCFLKIMDESDERIRNQGWFNSLLVFDNEKQKIELQDGSGHDLGGSIDYCKEGGIIQFHLTICKKGKEKLIAIPVSDIKHVLNENNWPEADFGKIQIRCLKSNSRGFLALAHYAYG